MPMLQRDVIVHQFVYQCIPKHGLHSSFYDIAPVDLNEEAKQHGQTYYAVLLVLYRMPFIGMTPMPMLQRDVIVHQFAYHCSPKLGFFSSVYDIAPIDLNEEPNSMAKLIMPYIQFYTGCSLYE